MHREYERLGSPVQKSPPKIPALRLSKVRPPSRHGSTLRTSAYIDALEQLTDREILSEETADCAQRELSKRMQSARRRYDEFSSEDQVPTPRTPRMALADALTFPSRLPTPRGDRGCKFGDMNKTEGHTDRIVPVSGRGRPRAQSDGPPNVRGVSDDDPLADLEAARSRRRWTTHFVSVHDQAPPPIEELFVRKTAYALHEVYASLALLRRGTFATQHLCDMAPLRRDAAGPTLWDV